VRSPITHFNGEKLKIDVVNMIKQQQLKSWSDLPIMGEESEERKSRATLQRR